eukprot:CAMPEP_0184010528 /NCGR_PEP_ID=MMETSP0954-20121128/3266_1 /TAXON_ID=627963 /ORGANISM="Aplanochytrium sp, Strain PBS07" /LENGTH=1204 /DNA_ID=CAMNT_0026290133 /DNA_START=236 /DNA_END=3850 /DNA_ORIENTATION=-
MDQSSLEQAGLASPGLIKRLIICTNVLPVKLDFNQDTYDWTVSFERDILFEDGPMYVEIGDTLKKHDDYEVLYVGVTPSYVPDEDRKIVEEKLKQVNCFPVWLEREQAHNHFQGFCKGVLWSTFHNVIDLYSKLGRTKNSSSKNLLVNDAGMRSNDGPETNEKSIKGRKTSVSAHDGADLQWAEQRQWSPMEAEACWGDHLGVNRIFASKVVEVYSEGDVVWVHDYHLLMLPSFLSRKLEGAAIGLFLHVPFPSSECFRILAHRDEILKSMLCADHVGFHLYEYARHFITCCKRMLGLESAAMQGGVMGISNNGRTVSITCSHVGLDKETILNRLADSQVQQLAHRFSPLGGGDSGSRFRPGRGFQNMKLIVGIDEIEGLRGMSLKLLGIMRFLEMYPEQRNSIVIKQIGVRLDSRPDDYLSTTNEVNKLIARINKRYGRKIIEYEERSSICLNERLALLKAADIFLVTPVRGGLNMLPFEYVLARNDDPGCLILSEFSACSRVLNGALRINPFGTDQLAKTIEQALNMSEAERRARRARDMNFIDNHSLYLWSKRIIKDIVDAHQAESESLVRLGFGLSCGRAGLTKKSDKVFQPLDEVLLSKSYNTSKKRVFFLDYSGTLVDTTSMNVYLKTGGAARVWHYANGGHRRPGGCLETRDDISDEVRNILIELCKDQRNHVFVISADLRDELEHAVAGIPNLGLIAENGYVYKLSPSDDWHPVVEETGNGAWYEGSASLPGSMTDSIDEAGMGVTPDDPKLEGWQDGVMDVMMPYTGRTNGSFCWRAPSAVTFNFVLADPELGQQQAENLHLELEYVLAGMPLQVERGKGFVTVRIAGVTRGAAVSAILSSINRKANLAPGDAKHFVDFILAFGDDVEDESLFRAVKKYKKVKADSYPVRVGWTKKKTAASYYVDLTEDVETALKGLCLKEIRRSASMTHFMTKENMMASNADSAFGHHRAPLAPEVRTRTFGQQSEVARELEARSEGLRKMNPDHRSATIASFRSDWKVKPSRKVGSSRLEEKKQEKTAAPARRNVIPHSPSYIASPDEVEAMFAGQPSPEAMGLPPAMSVPSSPPGIRLSENEYDVGVRDVRAIPPTQGDDEEGKETSGFNVRSSNELGLVDPEHIDNAEMYVSGMLATESGPDLDKKIDFVDVDKIDDSQFVNKRTLQMILSGALGAGLMFIMLNTGKDVTAVNHSRLQKPS